WSSDSFVVYCLFFFFSSRRRHTRFSRDWSSDVCSSDLTLHAEAIRTAGHSLGAVCDVRRESAQRLAEGYGATVITDHRDLLADRSEERRVGKECRSRWSPAHEEENDNVARRRLYVEERV